MGVPVHDDEKHFEMLILEGAQAGLSWETILKRRKAYRTAFKQFDVHVVSQMTDEELENLQDIQASTPESDALSKDLKKRGVSFVGSTIIYAYMQAVGMVNDHVVECFRCLL